MNYNNYFKNRGYSFSRRFLLENYNWFYSQWVYINKLINLKKYKNYPVLEIGSGIGVLYKFLRENKFKDYIGLELDKDACEFSNKTFKTNVFINNDFNKINLNKKSIIFAFEVLEHFENPLKAIKKIYSTLTDNGVFIGTTPYPFLKNIIADKTHLFVLHPKNWEILFKKAGFKRVNTYPLSFIPYLWRINKRLNIVLPFYVSLKSFVSTSLIIAYK